MKNNDGDDAFQAASLYNQASGLEILLRICKPPVRRAIELYELLGVYHIHNFHGYLHRESIAILEKSR